MSFVTIKNIYKVFGPKPRRALELVKSGYDKERLLNEEAHHLGLSNLSLEVERGEIFCIMGLSGSGKSTLVRHINRLIDPTDGHILVGNDDVMEFSRRELIEFRRHRVSMVFQRFGLLPHRTVLENAAYGLEVGGMSKASRQKSALAWLVKVGLEGYESSYPRQLSGGMQQRVGIARALATDPELLLMDEPFSALDPVIKREMQDVLLKLQNELHKTVIFITHDLNEAMRIGDRIAILKDGQLIQVDTPQNIVEQPADDYVRSFVKGVSQKTESSVQPSADRF